MKRHKRVTRRRFLQASTAAAAPLLVSASALGRGGGVSANERITVGIIGVGKMGSYHLDRFTEPKRGTRILAVCDVHQGRRERGKKLVEERQGKGCATPSDYREVLGRSDIDVVLIATPDHWHTTIAVEACKAKKDIYCEKPLTLTIEESKLLIDAVRKHDRVFQTGSQQRSNGPFREVCDYVRNGRLGEIKEVFVGLGESKMTKSPTSVPCTLPTEPVPAGVEWDRWLGQAPGRGYNDVLCRRQSDPGKYPFNPGWREFREYSGGYVTDWGAHHFDITQWALGMDQYGPVEIIPPQGDSLYGTQLIYRGSPVGHEIRVHHAKMRNGIRFVGERGEIFVNRGKKESTPKSILKEPLGDGDSRLFKSPHHHTNFLDCVRSRWRPICDVEIGARSVTVCHLVNLAIWKRRRMKWDPKGWEFPGDAEANGWRSRGQRDGYSLPKI